MKSKSFICAEEIILNSFTNSISAINIFENLAADRFPVVIPKIMWLNLIERAASEPEKKELYLVIYIDETEIHRMTLNAEFKSGTLTKNVAIVTNLSIPRAGIFRAVCRDGKEVLSSHDFKIEQVQKNGI